MRKVEDMGEGGVKKFVKSGDVLYGRPLKIMYVVVDRMIIKKICLFVPNVPKALIYEIQSEL